MGAAPSDLSLQNVVIVGGNFAGINAAKQAQKKGFKVTLLEPRDFAFISFGALRAAAASEGTLEKRLTVPLDRVLKQGGSLVRGRATGVDTATRTVSYMAIDASGNETAPATLAYDYLVLATGSTQAAPLAPVGVTAVGARGAFRSLQAAVRSANNIVVVGGGPCGIELCGEIRDAVPNARVSLVHSGSELLSGAGNVKPPPALSAKLLTRLAARNIAVTLNERVERAEGGTQHPSMGASVLSGPMTVMTSSGKALADVDLLIFASGAKPNTAWLAGGSLAGSLDATGHLRIARTYAVEGVERVFALGDCAGGPDAKAAWLLGDVAAIVAHNLKVAASGAGAMKTGKKDGFKGILVVPIGKKDGAGLLPFGVVGPWFTSFVKGGGLFLSKIGGEYGYSEAELQQQV